jgi:hypothetical protein
MSVHIVGMTKVIEFTDENPMYSHFEENQFIEISPNDLKEETK